MFALLGALLSLIGNIFPAVADIFKAKEDAKVKIDTNDVTTIQARQATLVAFRTDYGSLIARDLMMIPVGVWTCLYVWDKIVAHHFPQYVWNVAPIDEYQLMGYLPYAVIAFLFGTAWRGK